jgi:Flp pilus assembly protein TadD
VIYSLAKATSQALLFHSRTLSLSILMTQPVAHSSLGGALDKQGNTTAAIVAYEKAIAVDPDDAITRKRLGVALDNQGDTAAAVVSHKRAIAVDPGSTLYPPIADFPKHTSCKVTKWVQLLHAAK